MKARSRLIRISALILGVSWAGLASAIVPDHIAYQGCLVDLDGAPLAADGPRNYDVEFRIFDSPSGGDMRWAERQTITIDAGYFNVLLGRGAPVDGSTTNFLEVLSGLDADERYLDVSVSFAAEADFVPLTPRMRLLPAPYAFVSAAARGIEHAGEVLIDQDAETMVLNAPVQAGSVVANRISGDARELGSLHASNLRSGGARSSGTFHPNRLPNLSANQFSGTLPSSSLPTSLPTSLVNSGVFNVNRIPGGLAYSRIAGVLNSARIPAYPANRITSGIFNLNRIPNLNTSILSGTLAVNRGGTGRQSFTANRVILGGGSGRLKTSSQVRFGVGKATLRVESPAGRARDDWPSNYTGGIETWDIIAQHVRFTRRTRRSDARLKTNVVALAERDVVTDLLRLQPVSYEWHDEAQATGRSFGLIAQQVQEVLPEIVTGDGSEEDYLSLSYNEIVPLLIQAVQFQQETIDEGKERLRERRQDLATLKVNRDNLVRWLADEGAAP